MRLLFLTTSYPQVPGDGSGGFVHGLARQLVAAGHDVHVLAPASPESRSRTEDGVAIEFVRYGPRSLETLAHGHGIVENVRVAPWRTALAPSLLVALARTARARAGAVDVVHAHWLPCAVAARAAGRPRIVTAHGSDLALAARSPRLLRAAIAGAPTIVVADDQRDALLRAAPGADVRVIPAEGAPPVAPRPWPEGDPTVVFAGRLAAVKGADVLAAAWPQVRAAVPDARLVVAGDGPLRADLANLAGVELLGQLPRPALPDVYARAHVVAVPSRRETFGAVAIEAMACGRAIVATPVGRLARRVADGAGVCVPIGDAQALGVALIDLLRDPARAHLLGERAAAVAASEPSWDEVVAAVVAAYDDARQRTIA